MLYAPEAWPEIAAQPLCTAAANGGDLRYAGRTPAQYLSVALAAFGFWLLRRRDNKKTRGRVIALAFGLSSVCAGSDEPHTVEQLVAATLDAHHESQAAGMRT